MDITSHASFLPHDDPEASLAFYRDTLGFEVRNDVGYGGMRWITVGPPDQPGTSIVLHPPGAGHDGGRIVFGGTPADLVAARSTLTGEHLAAYVGVPARLTRADDGSRTRDLRLGNSSQRFG